MSLGTVVNGDGTSDDVFVLSLYYDPTQNRFVMLPVQYKFFFYSPTSGYTPETQDQFAARHPDPNILPFFNQYFTNLEAGVMARANTLLAPGASAPITPQTALDLDLNQFLRDTMPLKVVSWREH
jgi:hypothetical protein